MLFGTVCGLNGGDLFDELSIRCSRLGELSAKGGEQFIERRLGRGFSDQLRNVCGDVFAGGLGLAAKRCFGVGIDGNAKHHHSDYIRYCAK